MRSNAAARGIPSCAASALAMEGTGWSGIIVAMMIVSISAAGSSACASACATATAASDVALSSSVAYRRSLIPVSRTNSSSVRFGNAFRISLFARMFFGTAKPTPAMQTVSAADVCTVLMPGASRYSV